MEIVASGQMKNRTFIEVGRSEIGEFGNYSRVMNGASKWGNRRMSIIGDDAIVDNLGPVVFNITLEG